VVKIASWVFIMGTLVSCATAPTITPTPEPARIVVSPILTEQVLTWVEEFNESKPAAALEVITLPGGELFDAAAAGQAAVGISLTPPPQGWFATPLLDVQLAVVVNPVNPVRRLSTEELQGLFNGDITNWREFGWRDEAVDVLILLQGNELRSAFDEAVLAGAAPFSGAVLVPDPATMLALVTELEGAIGYLLEDHTSAELRQVEIDFSAPGSGEGASPADPLQLTIAAFAPEEPGGVVREWLAWIQAHTP
jgi:hypothetical protein